MKRAESKNGSQPTITQNGHWFGRFPTWMRERTDLSRSARLLFAILTTYADAKGVCWPGATTLAANMGFSRQHVLTLISDLEDAEVLRIERRPGKSNLYRLHLHSTSQPQLTTTGQPQLTTTSQPQLTRSRSSEVDPVKKKLNASNDLVNKILSHLELKRRGIVPDAGQLTRSLQQWRESYPNLDLAEQVNRVLCWLTDNPAKKKEDFCRFFGTWLSNARPTLTPGTTPNPAFCSSVPKSRKTEAYDAEDRERLERAKKRLERQQLRGTVQ